MKFSEQIGAVSEIDWARLAAYIDGEGCILIAKCQPKHAPRPYLYLDVRVANTDARLTDWLASKFGGKVYTGNRRNAKWAIAFHWVIACTQAAAILEKILPYLIIKREQAEVALALQKTKKRWGVKGAPLGVIESQYALREKLSGLKGTSSRKKADAERTTIQ